MVRSRTRPVFKFCSCGLDGFRYSRMFLLSGLPTSQSQCLSFGCLGLSFEFLGNERIGTVSPIQCLRTERIWGTVIACRGMSCSKIQEGGMRAHNWQGMEMKSLTGRAALIRRYLLDYVPKHLLDYVPKPRHRRSGASNEGSAFIRGGSWSSQPVPPDSSSPTDCRVDGSNRRPTRCHRRVPSIRGLFPLRKFIVIYSNSQHDRNFGAF
ncbi:hypothetical protein BDB13_6254 [Rhodococcus sp. OK302]|nr:hypothetical protein BDB13_6254 [Rhodococcus sp. OK302]